jgi:hypothetical protein
VPTGTDANVKYPSVFVAVSRTDPEIASFKEIFASLTTAPDGSETTPVRVAKMPCPLNEPVTKRARTQIAKIHDTFLGITGTPLSLFCNNDILLTKGHLVDEYINRKTGGCQANSFILGARGEGPAPLSS